MLEPAWDPRKNEKARTSHHIFKPPGLHARDEQAEQDTLRMREFSNCATLNISSAEVERVSICMLELQR